ncbi:hypothetical protein NHX12_029361 [Muraenolepis orangiensis]|uniref:Uncharacterized protein n=1 Tax=Muraenolepis orangiensis TaxID=630683 RepID=A0A9Q0EF80_9TELE|nr:hypothetical protein NHX12_029361 [Muraenolepis orangiensis]
MRLWVVLWRWRTTNHRWVLPPPPSTRSDALIGAATGQERRSPELLSQRLRLKCFPVYQEWNATRVPGSHVIIKSLAGAWVSVGELRSGPQAQGW